MYRVYFRTSFNFFKILLWVNQRLFSINPEFKNVRVVWLRKKIEDLIMHTKADFVFRVILK